MFFDQNCIKDNHWYILNEYKYIYIYNSRNNDVFIRIGYLVRKDYYI